MTDAATPDTGATQNQPPPRRPGLGAHSAWHGANLLLAFLLELYAIAGLALWGARTGHGAAGKAVLVVLAPFAAVLLWALFASPRPAVPVPFLRPVVKVAVFGSAVVGLWSVGSRLPATVLAVLAVANGVVLLRAGGREAPGRAADSVRRPPPGIR